MRRLIFLLGTALVVLTGCRVRPSPADAERGWERQLRASLPPGWRVVAVLGDPGRDKFFCWLEAPGSRGRTRRVEVRVSPRMGVPGGRDWEVHVHTPAEAGGAGPSSMVFAAPNDGTGPLELTSMMTDPEAVEAARSLAEEGVRQVRGLNLF